MSNVEVTDIKELNLAKQYLKLERCPYCARYKKQCVSKIWKTSLGKYVCKRYKSKRFEDGYFKF